MSTTDHEAARAVAEQRVSDVFEDDSPESLAAATAALGDLIRSCPGADALEASLAVQPIADLLGMGDASLPIWPAIIDALVDLAVRLADAAEAARVAGWAFWCCSSAPLDPVRTPPVVDAAGAARQPRDGHMRRPAAAAALRRRAPELRAWLDDAAAPRRAAAAMLLGATPLPQARDLAAIVGRAAVEDDRAALASVLLGGAVAAARLGQPASAAPLLARAHSVAGDGDALLRACAAAAVALAGAALDDALAAGLVAAASRPVGLPAAWGWRTPARLSYGSDALALALLGWVAVESSGALVPALAEVRLVEPGDPLQVGELLAGALVHLAFEARGRAIPRGGLMAWELDAVQRAALSAIARERPRAPVTLARLGLPPMEPDVVEELLAASSADFRPFAVAIEGQPAMVHFGRLWCLALAGAVPVTTAAAAVVAAFTADDALRLVTHFGRSRPQFPEIRSGSEAQAREQALALGVVGAVAAGGFDPTEHLRAAVADRRAGLAAIAERALVMVRDDRYRQALLRRLAGKYLVSGQLVLPAIPALLDHYLQMVGDLFRALTRPLDAAGAAELRGLLDEKLREAHAAAAQSNVFFKYEADRAQGTALRYAVAAATSSLPEEYDHWVSTRNGPLFGKHPDAKVIDIARTLGAAADVPVLDVGAGTGRNALALAALGHPVVALELAPSLADVLADEADRRVLPVTAQLGDIFDPALSLPGAPFRLGVVAEVVPHLRSVAELHALFARLGELAAEQSTLVMSAFLAAPDWTPDEMARGVAQAQWSSFFTREELAEAAAGTGWLLVSEEPTVAYEQARAAPGAWPPTSWFVGWAMGSDAFDMPAGEAPIALHWVVYRRGAQATTHPTVPASGSV